MKIENIFFGIWCSKISEFWLNVCDICQFLFRDKSLFSFHVFAPCLLTCMNDFSILICFALLTLIAPITTAADVKICNIMPYLLFLKKPRNLKSSSAANYRWRFKG